MHIPDGFLSPPVFLSCTAVALGALGYALKMAKKALQDKLVPLMGVMAAFIFAAQMVNFPVLGGTSGHLLGGVLAAITLGPFAGCIVISLVLLVQCLIFQDGGLTALGANIVNMAVAGSIVSYYLYAAVKKINPGHILVAVAVASWFSVVLAAILCALELAWSGTAALKLVFPAMAAVHMLIGIGEAVITVLIVSFILKVRPDLIYSGRRMGNKDIFIGLSIAAAIAALSFFASKSPDGLEGVAAKLFKVK